MIRGIKVTLYEKTQTGTDSFGAPIYEEKPVEVENVLVAEPLTEDLAHGAVPEDNPVYARDPERRHPRLAG